MERMTVKRKDGRWAIANNDGASPVAQMEKIPLAIDRLAAYEDTGLEPDEIDALQKREQGLAEMLVNVSCGCAVTYGRLQELAQAEKDGRLVVLPCKVGDTVYQTDGFKVYECKVKRIVFDTDGVAFDDDAIGKYVFRDREEAEAALKKREEACKVEGV